MPIIYGDRLVGRIDPRMDRNTNKLHINAIYAESHAAQDKSIGEAVGGAIENLATFLGAHAIIYNNKPPSGWRNTILA